MKKVASILLAVMVASVFVSGCYTKQCDPQPMSPMYKGEG